MLNCNIELICNTKILITFVRVLKNKFNNEFDVVIKNKNVKQCLILFDNNNR